MQAQKMIVPIVLKKFSILQINHTAYDTTLSIIFNLILASSSPICATRFVAVFVNVDKHNCKILMVSTYILQKSCQTNINPMKKNRKNAHTYRHYHPIPLLVPLPLLPCYPSSPFFKAKGGLIWANSCS